MELSVDRVIERRVRRGGGVRRLGWVGSAVVHAAVVAAAVVAPLLAERQAQPVEYVDVRIVPAAALGSPQPPRRSAPAKPVAPQPVPEKAPTPPPARPRELEPPATPATERPGSTAGTPAGAARVGASVAALDNPDFTYDYYIDQMLALIAANWVRPPLGGDVEAMIHFEIAPDGAVSEVRVVRSSGYDSFDLAGLRAIRSASPLPPLPRSYHHDSLGVNLILR